MLQPELMSPRKCCVGSFILKGDRHTPGWSFRKMPRESSKLASVKNLKSIKPELVSQARV